MLIAGLLIGLILLISYWTGRVTLVTTRDWLYLLVVIELLIALFIATATAATSMTREKESNTLELVLATPLTSHDIIKGKIIGLVFAAGPLLAIPFISILAFIGLDLLTGRLIGHKGQPVVYWETLLTLPILMIAFTAFACMLGLQSSIKAKKTLVAVFTSMGIVIGVYAATAGCALAVRETDARLAATFMPINPFTAPFIVINPEKAVASGTATVTADDLAVCRVIAFVAAIAAAAVYGLVGYGMHRSMVRNFDMIIRKQTA
jgi:ABC-type transport system involved in multi-copper enzyme maturation permease subunit